MDIWLPINPPICGDCGRPALFEVAHDDARVEVPVVCPHCGAMARAPRAIKMTVAPPPSELLS